MFSQLKLVFSQFCSVLLLVTNIECIGCSLVPVFLLSGHNALLNNVNQLSSYRLGSLRIKVCRVYKEEGRLQPQPQHHPTFFGPLWVKCQAFAWHSPGIQ